MGRIFVIGDIHGAFKALKQCLEISNFDYKNDTLIQLGDVVDGYSECVEVVDELLKIKNLISLKGNHDLWFVKWIEGINRDDELLWYYNGGDSTKLAYKKYTLEEVKDFDILNPKRKEHYDLFFKKQLDYYVDEQNRCFVHAGYKDPAGVQFSGPNPMKFSSSIDWHWDRTLVAKVMSSQHTPQPTILKPHLEVYVGHTPTICLDITLTTPKNVHNFWMIDTGAGWGYPLTIMDIDTKEYWQSEPTKNLYPNETGRR